MSGAFDNELLLAVYKAAVDEYRFEISLGWERQKVFLALNPTLIGLLSALNRTSEGHHLIYVVKATLITALIASLCGVLIVHKSHSYYRNAKQQLQAIEDALNVSEDLRIQTTLGMQESRGQRPAINRMRVVGVVQSVLLLYALVDTFLLFVL